MGVEQTEIDALAALRPALLRKIAADAISPFFDSTLEWRVMEAHRAWQEDAQRSLDEQTSSKVRDRLHAEAKQKLDAIREQITAIKESMRLDATSFDLPPIEVPDAVLPEIRVPMPLIDSRDPFAEQCRRLIDSKRYAGDND